MAATNTELTARLEPAKRQFHQWFYREFDSIRQVKVKMDILSKALRNISDYDFKADEGRWKNRQRQRNKEWDIKKSERGLHLPTPADVVGYPLWQTENGDVGDWRSAAHKDSDG